MGLYVNPIPFQNDEKGRTTPFARLDFYVSGTFDRKNTYADAALTVLNSNPVVADGAGRFPQIFMASDEPYRVVFSTKKNASEYTGIWTADGVSGLADATDIVLNVASIADLPPATGSGNKVNVTSFYPGWAVVGDGLPKGGGVMVDSPEQSVHNSVTAYDPLRSGEIGTAAYYNAEPAINCWVRVDVEHIDPYWAGATGLGIDSDTVACEAAYAVAKSLSIPTRFGPGRFKVKLTFDGGSQVFCAGMRNTIFVQEDSSSWCIRIYGTGNNALGATLEDCSITAVTPLGIGLEIGDAGAASSASNAKVSRLEINGFAYNWNMTASIMSTFNDIYSFGAVYDAITFGSERNVTTCTFNNCRFRLSDVGVNAQSGHNIVWNNVNIESNRVSGLRMITGLTSGPTSWVFNGGDIEDNGAAADAGEIAAHLNAGVYIDANATIGQTKPNNAIFNRTVCTSPAGALDVSAIRAEYVLFDRCDFSRLVDGGWTSSKFYFNSGTSAVRVHLQQCGEIQELPTPTMYANFPALVAGAGGPFGFSYEFEYNGKTYSNRELSKKVVEVITADATSMDVRGVGTIVIDTTTGNVNLNSLDNGLDGQQIDIIKPAASNNAIIKHNGTGNEKIFTYTGIDVTLTGRQGSKLTFYNGTWYMPQN